MWSLKMSKVCVRVRGRVLNAAWLRLGRGRCRLLYPNADGTLSALMLRERILHALQED